MKTTINTCIMITVNNPSAAVMEYLAKRPTIDANLDVTIVSTPVQPQHSTQPDPQDTALRIASVADIDNYLDVGTEVHWHGAKFVFDGVMEKINDYDLTEDEINPSEKFVFIRRNDTDKLVSLTLRDLQTGRLTLND